VIGIPEAEAGLLERTARSLVSAGASLTGEGRRDLAIASRAAARAHAAGDSVSEQGEPGENMPLTGLVNRVTVAPATIRPEWVSSMAQAGVSAPIYVEVLGLVGRLQAVYTFCFALGQEPVELPEATDGAPTGRLAPDAALAGGWVPTVGPASPPSVLSSVPDEHEAMHDLHGVFYLSVAEMADLDADRGLHRTQMELVAARTSLINECFF